MSSAPSRYVSVEIPDDRLVGWLAREAGLNDARLNGLEAHLVKAESLEAAALALTIGRVGRATSQDALHTLQARFVQEGAEDLADAVQLARALLAPIPVRVAQAERGYRFEQADRVLYVDDPIAAHWHYRQRWGPPLRPVVEHAQIGLGGPDALGRGLEWALDGRVVVIPFAPPRRLRGSPVPPLRVTRAGFSRDAGLRTWIRWSQVRSVGWLETRRGRRVAYQVDSGAPQALPEPARISGPDLLAMMERLLNVSRS